MPRRRLQVSAALRAAGHWPGLDPGSIPCADRRALSAGSTATIAGLNLFSRCLLLGDGLGRTPLGPQESPAGRRKVPPVSGRAQKARQGRGRDAGGSGQSVCRELGELPPGAAGAAAGWRGAELSAAARPPLGFSRYPLSWVALVPIHALGALSGALSALASLPRQLSLPAADTPGCDADGATTLDTGHARLLGYFPRQLALSVNAPASQSHILLV